MLSADNQSLILWEKAGHRQIRTFGLGMSKILDFDPSPDGKTVVVSFNGGGFVNYDLQTGKKIWEAQPASYSYSATFFDNGQKIFAVGSDDGYVLSASNGQTLKTIKNMSLYEGKAFIMDGNTGIVAHQDYIKTVNLDNPAQVLNTKLPVVMQDFAVSTKHKLLFFQKDNEGGIEVFDLEAQKVIKSLPFSGYELHLTVTDEQDALFVQAQDDQNKIKTTRYALPALNAQPVNFSPLPEGYMLTASSKNDHAFGADGGLYTLSKGARTGYLKSGLWDINPPINAPKNYWSTTQLFGFMSDYDDKYRLLDLKTGQPRCEIDLSKLEDGGSEAFDFSEDGSLLAVITASSSDILVYETATGKLRKKYPIADLSDHYLKFSPTGKTLFYQPSGKNGVSSLDLATGRPRFRFESIGGSYHAFSSNGQFIASIDANDGGWEVGVWELETGRQLMRVPHKADGYFRTLDVSSDGKYVLVIDQYEPKVYDTSTGAPLPDIKMKNFDFAAARWSGKGNYYAVGQQYGNLTIGKVPGGDLRASKPHGNSITNLLFSADDKIIFTTAYDNTIGINSLADGSYLGTLYGFPEKDEWLVTTPDGRFDGSPAAFKKLYYVNGYDVLPLDALFEKFHTPGLYQMLLSGAKPAPTEDDISKLKPAPKVKIIYNGKSRNLTVEEDIPSHISETERISLSIEATCPEDGVSEIRLFHNEKLVENATRNLVVEDDSPANKSLSKTFEIQLDEGENRFRAVALNTQRTESQPDEIIIKYKAAKPAPGSTTVGGIQCWLVVVGINQYKNPKYNLNYATADAKAFKESVEQHAKTIFSKINPVFIQDAQANRGGIVAALEQVKNNASPKDVLIFYYAGHGVMNDKKEFYLVPQDVTQLYGADEALAQKGLSASQLQQFSKEIKAQKQLFILDACQSAGALETVAMRGVAEEKAIAQLARSTGTHWLTASGSEQFAAEFDQLGHGAFTYTLLEALSGKADAGGDGKITVKEIDAYLQENVPVLTQKYKGSPQFPASYGFGNDFPVGVK